jgi:hypothetical protein
LFRYFAKAFGCQLHDAGIAVAKALSEMFVQENYGNTYRVSICINSKKLDGFVTFELMGHQDENGKQIDYHWAQDNGWFTLSICGYH